MSVLIASAIYWADWPHASDTTFEVRAKSNRSWVSAESQIVGAGESRVVGTGTITALRPTLPNITLPSTSAGLDDQTARWTVTLHRVGKTQPVTTVLADFPLPVSFEPSTTWAQIKIHKNGKQPLRDTSVYTKTETDYQIALAMGNLNRAGVGVLGRIETATIPSDPLHPKAVLDEDPRLLGAGFYFLASYASLAAAVTAIGSDRATLLIEEVAAVAANLTIPSNITLFITSAGGIQPANGVTVTILGPIEATPIKIFYNAVSGQGTVRFTDGTNSPGTYNIRQQTFWVEWWGAIGDNATDSTAALNAAFVALPHGRTMRFGSNGFYWVTSPIVVDHKFQVTVIGNDSQIGYSDNFSKPILVWKGADDGEAVFKMSNVYASTFKGIGTYSTDGVSANSALRGFYLTQVASGYPALSSRCALIGLTAWALNSPKAGWCGIDINDGVGANNEHHIVDEAIIVGNGSHTVTNGIGIRLGHSQVKAVQISRCNITSCGVGISVQGSFRATNNSMASVYTCYELGYLTDASYVYGDDIETLHNYINTNQHPGGAEITFQNCRMDVIHADGDVIGDYVVKMVGKFTFIGCSFLNNDLYNVRPFGPYAFIGDSITAEAVFINCTLQLGSEKLADGGIGLETTRSTIIEGSRIARFGHDQYTPGLDSVAAAPSTAGLRRTINLSGPSATGVPPAFLFDTELGFYGIPSVNNFRISVVGTPGATTRRFVIVGVDSAGRRAFTSFALNGDLFVQVTNAHATLDGTNYLKFDFASSSPAPANWAIYEVNPANSFEWRLAASFAHVPGLYQTYNLQANPAGSFVTRPFFNESAQLAVNTQMYFPNEQTFTSLDATPSVAIGNDFLTANAGATTITNFDDGTVGQEIRVRIGDANSTIQNNATIITGTGADIVGVNGAVYKFIKRGTAWRRVL